MSSSLLEKLRQLAKSKDDKPPSKKIFENTQDVTEEKPLVKKSVRKTPKKDQKGDDITKDFEFVKRLLDEISKETTKPKEKKKRNLSDERKEQLRLQIKKANDAKLAKRNKMQTESEKQATPTETMRHVEAIPEPRRVESTPTEAIRHVEAIPAAAQVQEPKLLSTMRNIESTPPHIAPKQNIIYVSKSRGNKNKFT